MTDQKQKKQLQIDAGIPHLPTDLTYQCRIAISGEGERGWEWQDKPHRLVYDLCRQVEADADRIDELVKERDEFREVFNTSSILLGETELQLGEALAKLTKAMTGLRKIADHKHFSWDQGWMQNTEARIASATLAELEGGE